MKKPHNNARKIIIDNEIWHWKFGKSITFIWNPLGKKFILNSWEVAGYSDPDSWERDLYKRNASVTPSVIRENIRVLKNV